MCRGVWQGVWLGLRAQGLVAVFLGLRGFLVCHRGNSIIVWVNSLDPHLCAPSIWSKPIECLYEWIPKTAVRACPIFISMHFRHITVSLSILPITGPQHNAVLSSGSSLLPQVHPLHRSTADELTRQVPYCSPE